MSYSTWNTVTTTDWSKYLAAHHSSSCLPACIQWEQTNGGRLQRYHTFKAAWRVNRQSQSTVIYTFEPSDFRNICKCCLYSFIHSFPAFLIQGCLCFHLNIWQTGCKRQSNNGFQGDSECSVLRVTPYFCFQAGTDQWVQSTQPASSGTSNNHTNSASMNLTCNSIIWLLYLVQFLKTLSSSLTKNNLQVFKEKN